MGRPGTLVNHNHDWALLAEQEMHRIQTALGSELVQIHHIGNTAIPKIKAKAVLDFLGLLNDLHYLDKNPALLEGLGYLARGEFSIPSRRYFSKDSTNTRIHQLQCFKDGDPEGTRHLLFRDYLRAHPERAMEYERLKEQLARQFPNDTQSNAKAKTPFIQKIEAEAIN